MAERIDGKFILPVTVSDSDLPVTGPLAYDIDSISALLRNHNIQDFALTEILQGGFMSQVYAGVLGNQRVVLKHSEDLHPKNPTIFLVSKDIMDTEVEVLSRLSGSSLVKVPRIIEYYPALTTLFMEDLREEGYEPMIGFMENGILPQNSAVNVGKSLAHLYRETQSWVPFQTTLSAKENIYERGLEMLFAYPNSHYHYEDLAKRFTTENQGWIWVDSTPKNIMMNTNGDGVLHDFGTSCFADQQHMLPTFLSHIAIYSLTGYIDKNDAVTYIRECIDAFRELQPIDETAFCKYFGMEVLHRSMGKRMPIVRDKDQKLALTDFGLSIFDYQIESIDDLLTLFS